MTTLPTDGNPRPWASGHVATGPATPLDGVTIRSFWEQCVERQGDALFLEFDQAKWSYAAFDLWVNRAAHWLLDHGVRAGSHVALWLPNSADTLRLHFALHKLGAVVVPMITQATNDEAMHVLRHSQAELLLSDHAVNALSTDIKTLSDLRGVIGVRADPEHLSVGTYEDADDASSDEPTATSAAPEDLALLLYTSGSTGKPKGVMIPSQGFVSTARAFVDHFQYRESDNYLLTLPMFHAAGAVSAPGHTMACGGALTVMPRWRPSRFWELVRNNGVTVTTLFPSQVAMLMTAPEADDDRDHPLRLLVTHEYPADFVYRYGVEACTIWGMTETSGICTATRPGSALRHRPGLVGTPMRNVTITIRDSEGAVLPAGTTGEIWLHHPHNMLGYYDDAVATHSTLTDGWVRSGDLGMLDEGGDLYFRGRIKHLIKRSGENISGEEVEEVLRSHPDVLECVVIGVPDTIRTEEVYIMVVTSNENLAESALYEWCLSRISSWKAPRYIDLRMAPLPRLPNEKFDRRAVADAADVANCWDREVSTLG